MSLNLYYHIVLLLLSGFLFFAVWQSRKSSSKLPPGPRGLPLIGNIHQAPRRDPWKTFNLWAEEYGPIFSLKYGQRIVIVLGSHKTASDLFSARTKIYSSRPIIRIQEYLTKGMHMGVMQYTPEWMKLRKTHTFLLSPHYCARYRQLQDLESMQLIYDMLETDSFSKQFRRYTASLGFALAYGTRIQRDDAEEIDQIERIAKVTDRFFSHGISLVLEMFPCVHDLWPVMLPLQKICDAFHQSTVEYFTTCMRAALQKGSWNWINAALEFPDTQTMSEITRVYNIGVLQEAALETTQSALNAFVLASVLNPAAVCKVQEELDKEVGDSRLPGFDDMTSLPYTQAFIKETLRWCPVAPLGAPHSNTEVDEYMGYEIPKGAVIVPNIWGMHRDPEIYHRPNDFLPERWLEQPDLPLSVFGFGKRICVGQELAMNSLFIIVSRMLWAFQISPASVGGRNVAIDPENMIQSIISGPSPFEASFTVRDSLRAQIIRVKWISSTAALDVPNFPLMD
ncbi:uncharacterized protein BHQ10_002238 [Talaromyces amestolkiae]|uniref:Cytochrome P450 n=1 Tax=Talaromyces amestolkiae TaxID=1196081 RepID=A0A364KRP8_TALAM|nr:uncharacterized protein BHQ10_002238 [Talaromyces amestolkiae]RAO66226.1 hypothetical protein BHQ10_002238 [Talaromyces amestolkiae]